jgi:hypothetical protein
MHLLETNLKQGRVLSKFPQKTWTAAKEEGNSHTKTGTTAETDFVFCGNRRTQNECFRKLPCGAPEKQLPPMRRCLEPGTPLLLFNAESRR